MHDAEVSGVPASDLPHRRRKRGRVPVNALAHEKLFLLLANLRAANAESLYEMFFKAAAVPLRTAMRRLHDLVDAGFLAHLRLDGARCVYHMTPKTLSLTPALQSLAHSSLGVAPQDRQAMYCWLRSTLHAKLTADGWTVGSDAAALYALRRFMIDTLEGDLGEASRHARPPIDRAVKTLRDTPLLNVTDEDARTGRRWRCFTCEKYLPGPGPHEGYVRLLGCTGTAHAVPVAPCDIAYRGSGLARRAMLLLVDNPSAPLERQLKDLPVFVPELRVPLLARTTDQRSKFDRGAMKWKQKGERHRELDRAIADGWVGRCTTSVDSFLDLQAYYAR